MCCVIIQEETFIYWHVFKGSRVVSECNIGHVLSRPAASAVSTRLAPIYVVSCPLQMLCLSSHGMIVVSSLAESRLEGGLMYV